MIPRIIRFLCLKAMEIIAFLGIPFCIGKFACMFPAHIKCLGFMEIPTTFGLIWAAGFLSLIFLVLLLLVIGLLVYSLACWIKKNWELAE